MSNLMVVKGPICPPDEAYTVLEGLDYPLIKEGLYEAVLIGYETSTRYSKRSKDNKFVLGGKIYLHFHVDPYKNAGLSGSKVIIFMPLNARQ